MNPDLSGPSGADPFDITNPDGFRLRGSGDLAYVGDRLVPTWLEIEMPGDAGSPTSMARIEVRDGAARVVEVRLVAREGEGEVRQTDLRRVSIDALLLLPAAFSFRVQLEGDSGIHVRTSLSRQGDVDPAAVEAIAMARANRKITPAFLREVAEVYRQNMRSGPTKAVKERYFVSERMAGKYVRLARDAGLLPPTTKGKKNATAEEH